MMSSHLKMSKPAQSNTSLSSGVQPSVTEYSIRCPKNMKHKHHVMRFNYNLNVDFSQWRNVKMERENNMREFKSGLEEDAPKFGAGSEYNRDQKEEARRKKFGIIAKKYNPDAQPWILKVNSGKSGKKFRGIREGGVSENAAHFIFTQTKDGSIEAFPLNEWYNFQPIQRYKALTAEEAEEEFGRRKKCVNLWSMKMRMKLKNKDEEEVEDPEDKAVKGSKGGDKKKLMISEMDEWMDSDDMSSASDEEGDAGKKKKEEGSDDEAKTKKKKGKAQPKKKKKVNDEAFEDSDDGDEEGLERDYISDSSDSESEPEIEKINKELKSVAEEPALQKLLTSDEDSDEEKSEKNDEESEDEKSKKADDAKESKENEVKAAPTKEKKKDDKKSKMQKFYDAINQKPGTGNASDFSSDSEDSEADPMKKVTNNNSKKKKNTTKNEKSGHNSRAGTPVDSGIKRKIDITSSDNSNSPQSTPAKKLKSEPISITPLSFNNFSSSKDSFSNTEEAVRRYLMRKPMTTTELLKKIQSKKTGVSSDELVEMMTQILKKINPSRQRIQGKMYLSLKAT
ncbi:unnamed protein product [Chironomus riparius]|uniref:Transcription initiation factor IIF subunit alpha n=1 Tax=Chironomus riparius TaxID=315576 RepID=A0A9N9RZL0_9DIPT|nr:unnamed protein product [Chironomus riparius]